MTRICKGTSKDAGSCTAVAFHGFFQSHSHLSKKWTRLIGVSILQRVPMNGALRDQSVSSSRCRIFVTGDTKEKESIAQATKDSRPLKAARALRVTAWRHRKETLLSPLRKSRRGANASRNAGRELVAHGDKQFGTRWRAYGRIACNVTPTDADRRKAASWKSGILRSSRLRIDPIEISFKTPTAPFIRRITSKSRRPVLQTSSCTTTEEEKKSNERLIWH